MLRELIASKRRLRNGFGFEFKQEKYETEREKRNARTRYQTFSQPRGIKSSVVGQEYWHVMMMMPSRVTNMAKVRFIKNGRNTSMLV